MDNIGEGVVGMIDALGFKGIWQRHAPDMVADTLRAARNGALGFKAIWEEAEPREFFVTAFSDTIAVATRTDRISPGHDPRPDAIAAVALTLATIQMQAAKRELLPLTYRGVITTGTCFFDEHDQILVGGAVDEAASLMARAAGAFVWLAPGASTVPPVDWSTKQATPLLVPYDVPLKGGDFVTTMVVNPFFSTWEPPPFERVRAGYRRAMESPDIDVAVKRRNTERFLDYVESRSQATALR